MTLRRKTILIIGLTVLGLVSLLYTATRYIVLDGFLDLEHDAVERNVDRACRGLDRSVRELTLLAADYAAWDDTLRFLDNPAGDDYVESNLGPTTFIENDFDLLLIRSTDGRTVFRGVFNVETGAVGDPPEALRDLPRRFPALFIHADGKRRSGHQGFILTAAGPLLVSSQPITNSTRSLESAGTLLVARLLDEEEVLRVRNAVLLDVTVCPLTGEPAPDARFAAVLDAPPGPDEIIVRSAGLERVNGYRVLADASGVPGLLLRVSMPRTIFARGSDSLHFFLATLLAVCLVFVVASTLLLERAVITRVTDLSRNVRRIGRRGTPSRRVRVSGNDEIARLGGAINVMLDALQQSEGTLRNVAGHARCLLWSAAVARQPDGRLSTVEFGVQDSGAAVRLFPIDQSAQVNFAGAWIDARHPEDAAAVQDAPFAAIDTGRSSYSLEYRIRMADGAERWVADEVDISAEPGDQWRLVGVCTDVTAFKRAAAELQQTRDAALDIARVKSEFLANMSHELRTPMNGIVGMTSLLLGDQLTDEQREHADMLRDSADTLMRVINDILDFSRIDGGRLDLAPRDFDLLMLTTSTIDAHRATARNRDLDLRTRVDDDVARIVRGDPGRLRQVLNNLLDNALKFTEHGSVTVEVTPGPDDHVVFAVEDTGVGVPEDRRGAIFSPFSQVDASATRVHGGSGLGLAISASIVALMDGEIRIEDPVEGPGSRFVFTARLPASDPDHDEISDPPPPSRSARTPAVLDRAAALQRAGDDPALLVELADMLGQDLTRFRSDLVDAAAAEDLDIVRRIATDLCGSLATIGAEAAVLATEHLLQTVSSEDTTAVGAAVATVTSEIDRLVPALASIMEQRA